MQSSGEKEERELMFSMGLEVMSGGKALEKRSISMYECIASCYSCGSAL